MVEIPSRESNTNTLPNLDATPQNISRAPDNGRRAFSCLGMSWLGVFAGRSTTELPSSNTALPKQGRHSYSKELLMLNARLRIKFSLAVQMRLRWISALLAFLFRR